MFLHFHLKYTYVCMCQQSNYTISRLTYVMFGYSSSSSNTPTTQATGAPLPGGNLTSYDYWQCDSHHHHELLERATELQKLPQHLVLVIAPEDRYVDAALLKRIFGYAQIIGIPYLSVYDTRTPKNGYVDLSRFCQTSGNESRCFLWPPSQQSKEQRQQVQLNGCKTVHSNGTTNGNASNGAKHYAQLQVYQIGTADGHALIADVCRELYENRSTPQVQELLKERQALTDGISAMLSKRLGFVVPEPELGIIFSRLTCIYGLLPWHVRFTEFHTHRSGCYFDAKSFAKVLYKYARCEQRWGK
ncbi:hypothetical protein ACLKA6_014520 [Drosophila palustris]